MTWPAQWTGWMAGLSDMHPLLAWLGVPLLLALAASFGEAQAPRWRWLGQLVFWSLLLALGLRLGRYALRWHVPHWVWIAAIVLLPWRLRSSASPRLVMLAWLYSLCAGLVALLHQLSATLPRTANDALMAFALAGWTVCALLHWVWPRHREPPAPALPPAPPPEPDAVPPPALDEAVLRRHLDSEAAQEGADKYTRE